MAKLNGVVLTAEAIAYNGVKYEKIDVTPKAGDILRVDETGSEYVTTGAYYKVEGIDSNDDPQIIDNIGDDFDGYFIEYTLFRKVSVPQTQQYREVNRKAEVGEKAKVVGGYSHSFKRGDIVVAITEQSYVTNGVRFRRDDGYVQTLVHTYGDYVVLEPIVEQSDDIIEVDGVKYRKVDRKPKVGDFVYMLHNETDLTKGKVYEIKRLGVSERGVFFDDMDDERSFCNSGTSKGRILVERIATADDLQRQVSELQSQLAEAESKLATQKAEEEKAKDPRIAFEKGDKVRLVSGGGVSPLYGYKNGNVYTVNNPRYLIGNKIQITGGEQQTGYALPSQLAKLSEQEIAEMDRLKVGEYAKVIGGSTGRVGDIVIVGLDDKSTLPFKVYALDGARIGWKHEKNVVRATVEEVAEARRKLEEEKAKAEEVAKWAAIGREVGEFKKGDVVRYNSNTGGNALNEYNGIVTTIVEVNGVLNSPRYRLEKPVFVQNSSGTWARGNHLTLIAPAGSVVSLAVAN